MQNHATQAINHAAIDIHSFPACSGGGLGNSAKAPEVILLEIPAWLVTHEPASDKLQKSPKQFDATYHMNQMRTWFILIYLMLQIDKYSYTPP